MPAGIALHARLSNALLANARRDLGLAPMVLMDRSTAIGDALSMHAKELARNERLAAAVAQGDRSGARQALAAQTGGMPSSSPVVVGSDATTWSGPPPSPDLIDATRKGSMPVSVTADSSGVRYISLAPIERNGTWVGAAGFALPMNEDAARVLAGLTRSDVVILASSPRTAMATTLDSTRTSAVVAAVRAATDQHGVPHEIDARRGPLLVTWAPLGSDATVAFVRVVDDELSVLPSLRRIAITLATASTLTALLLGVWLTTQVTKPVRSLSEAARAFGAGHTDVALPPSRFEDIAVVSRAFAEMRTSLAARLMELEQANRSLSDHSTRLAALQNDLLQRERLDAVNRMVGQLAHEVRNPIASLRNLLELIRRRAGNDEQTERFANLAIDELLRMHELAERMLDLNRPSARGSAPSDAHRVAMDVASLSRFGGSETSNDPDYTIEVVGSDGAVADIASDPLKQVLLNLVRNAREALVGAGVPGAEGRIVIAVQRTAAGVRITVRDNGPGIAADILPRVFDPFVTTKQQVHGVGLGLYIAESTVRAAGGTISAHNEPHGGAEFLIDLPARAGAA